MTKIYIFRCYTFIKLRRQIPLKGQTSLCLHSFALRVYNGAHKQQIVLIFGKERDMERLDEHKRRLQETFCPLSGNQEALAPLIEAKSTLHMLSNTDS